jgi:long-chain acyl-CoA synthetase
MAQRPWQRHYDYNVPTTIRYPRITAGEILGIPSNAHPDKPAFNFYGSQMTFWQVRLEVLRLANALGEMGINKGDRVGIHLPTCPQYMIAYHAVLMIGGIVVNMNPMYTADELTLVAGNTEIRALITFDMVLANIHELCKRVDISTVIVTRVTDYIEGFGRSTAKDMELAEGWRHFSEVIDGCSNTRIPRVVVVPEDPALIQFTGGTTGVPKGAVLTHANVVAAVLQVSLWGESTVGITPIERRSVMAVLPYFHVYGLVVVMGWALFNCATQIMVPRFDLEEFIGILGGFEDITFFPAVPTLVNAVFNHPKAPELNLGKKLGLLNSGAAPMPVELIEMVKDMGVFYSEGWGMSETTSLGIANPILGMKKVGSIGLPWPDTDIKLVSPDDGVTEVPQGEPGEILIKSPLVMKEYWNQPEETAGQLVDGWLRTGDVAVQDEDDYFFIVDRKKDMIIAGGYNIYPREIDEVLFQHPKVRDAVTVGVPDEYRGETVKAFVVLEPDQTASEEEIIEFCRGKLAAFKAPREVEFRTELPKSAVGKVLRKVLREEEAAKRKK